MSTWGSERLMRLAAVSIAVVAGFGALLAGGQLEVTLLMVAAVVAGLICFDTAMAQRLRAFGPWTFLSIAPVLKTVPTVWAELRSESGLLFERYDHAGSLLLGVCVFAAAALLARPAARLGSSINGFAAVVVVGSSLTGAVAGASVAFLFDGNFGSSTAGRLLETPTWFVLSGMLAAAAIAASHARVLSGALAGVLAAVCATAALLALSVAGRQVDSGWWALLFAAFAASTIAADGALGERSRRDRRSTVAVVVALVVGFIAAASAIAARSDSTAWGPGWVILGLLSLAMFGLALTSKPVDEPLSDDYQERARRARARAQQALQAEVASDAHMLTSEPVARSRPTPAVVPRSAPDPVPAASSVPPAISTFADQSDRRAGGAPSHVDVPPNVVRVPTAQTTPTGQHAPSSNRPLETENVAAPPVPQPERAPAKTTSSDRAPSTLSDAGTVESARVAAEVRDAPHTQRHSLAPLAQAHHFDPSTGLLSSAGLQHAIARAFDVPRSAGHVTMLMFMIRDLDSIERDHGRLASAAVTREVADRIDSLLPRGTGARFARSAYAVLFVGDLSNVTETTQWLARVLLQLRAPVEGGSLGDKIDVVAGMAQCYEREDAAQFVERANLGLVRAVQLPEPTLVAMP